MLLRLRVLIASVVLLCSCVALAADTVKKDKGSSVVFGGDVTLTASRGSVLAVGGTVVVADGTIDSAAIAAGTVHVTGGTIENMAVAGGTVAIDGGRLGDVLAAAGTIKVNTLIAGDLRAAGGTVTTTRDAVIGGDARLSGGDVAIDGTIKNSLRIRAEHISLAGTVGGTVYLYGGDINIAPGTHIGGDLVYAADQELKLPSDVTVGGDVVWRGHEELEEAPDSGMMRHFIHALWPLGTAGLLLCGLIVAFILPSVLVGARDVFVHEFGKSLLIGLVVACAVPVAATVLAITVVGIPLALLLMAVVGAFAGFGLLVACAWAGDRVRDRFGRPVSANRFQELGWALVGFVVFILAGVVPTLGGIAQTVAILAGSGAAFTALWSRRPFQPAP